MGKKRKELSQAEVWDDSALLQSWDEALAEYKVVFSSVRFNYLLISNSSTTASMLAVSVSRM